MCNRISKIAVVQQIPGRGFSDGSINIPLPCRLGVLRWVIQPGNGLAVHIDGAGHSAARCRHCTNISSCQGNIAGFIGSNTVDLRIYSGFTSRTWFSLGSLGTDIALFARLSFFTLRAHRTLFTFLTLGTYWTLFSPLALDTLFTFLTLGTYWTLDALFSLLALRTLLTFLTRRAYWTLFSLFTLETYWTLFSLFTLGTYWTLFSLWPLGTDLALRTLWTIKITTFLSLLQSSIYSRIKFSSVKLFS